MAKVTKIQPKPISGVSHIAKRKENPMHVAQRNLLEAKHALEALQLKQKHTEAQRIPNITKKGK
jgi:hypothetical protein